MRFSSYQNIKPIPNYIWCKEIPEHWESIRLGFLIEMLVGNPFSSEKFEFDGGTRLVRGDNVTEGRLRWGDKQRCWPEVTKDIERYVLSDGDVLIGMDGSKVGKNYVLIRNEDLPLLLVQRVARLRSSNKLSPNYLRYLIGSPLFLSWVDQSKTDPMVPHITAKDIRNFRVCCPSYEEQKAIACFLDFKTAQIDNLIAKQQVLLDKLAEKRTALISHAVTKGLDPSVPMKDAKVAWLGNIPKHWEVWKVTHGFERIGSGTTPKSDNPLYYDGNIPWVTTSELRETVILDTAQKVTEEAVSSYSALKIYPKSSLAIAMYGATIGRLGILGIPATVNQACCVFSMPKIFDTKFVYYWLWMRRPILISISNGGGQPNLSQDDLKKIWIPIPSLDEQAEIVEFLDGKLATLGAQQDKVEQVIQKLVEYRSAIITNAVTGKIDVRGIQFPQPADEIAS